MKVDPSTELDGENTSDPRAGLRTYGARAQNDTRKNSMPRGIHCCLFFIIVIVSFDQPASLYCEEYVYIYTCLTAYKLQYMNYRSYQITLQRTLLHKPSGRKCWLDISH